MSPNRVTANLSMISTPTDMPSDVYKFMIQNASSRQRSKLMETGKFFYPKEFVKIDHAIIDRNEIKLFKIDKNWARKDVTAELSQSLWITRGLHIKKSTDAMIRSLPKTAVWNLPKLSVSQQVISYETVKFLTSGKVMQFILENCPIQHDDNKKVVPLEKIFELLPRVYDISITGDVPSLASLEAILPLKKHLSLSDIDEKFDFKTFANFMINNQNIRYLITFKKGISATYANELKSIIAKIKNAWIADTDKPKFRFY